MKCGASKSISALWREFGHLAPHFESIQVQIRPLRNDLNPLLGAQLTSLAALAGLLAFEHRNEIT